MFCLAGVTILVAFLHCNLFYADMATNFKHLEGTLRQTLASPNLTAEQHNAVQQAAEIVHQLERLRTALLDADLHEKRKVDWLSTEMTLLLGVSPGS